MRGDYSSWCAPRNSYPPVEPKCNCGIGGGKDDPGHNDQGMGCEASNHSHPLTKPDQIDITDFRVRCSDDRQTISMSVSWSRTERAAVYKVYWYNGSNLLNPGGSEDYKPVRRARRFPARCTQFGDRRGR